MIRELEFPNGIRLLSGWQRREEDAIARLREVMDATIAGQFDSNFIIQPPKDHVNIGGSVNMTTLGIMHDLYGFDSAEFYKGDPERYVRSTMMTRRLLGMNKLYISWAVYALTAEALGQETMYPDRFPPGPDPDLPCITRDNWKDVTLPDLNSGVPRVIHEMVACYEKLTGLEPILQISAPYNLAADTFGQEPLLSALINDPEFVNQLLDHLVDNVHRPWIDHFFKNHPNGWVELSDASGSPFFIGPENCKNFAIRAIRRLKEDNPWGHRIYDANYRGDYVGETIKKERRSGRKDRRPSVEKVDLAELTEQKFGICHDFVIRLHDDRVPLEFYENEALRRNIPLFAGIGSAEVDRHAIGDLDAAKAEMKQVASQKVRAVKNVAHTISKNGYNERNPPWPGTLYFEDISSEASFDLVEIAVRKALEEGAL